MSPSKLSRRSFVATAAGGAAGLFLPGAGFPSARFLSGTSARAESDLAWLSLAEASELVRSRKISPVELTNTCLHRIAQLDSKFNAFITVLGDSARAEAREAEAEIQRGHWRGPLHGIPIALKDLLDTAGVRTTAASGVFKDRVPKEDAEVVARLKKAGAVLLGKLNMHEFAYGGSTVISFFGPVRNPWNTDYCAGGSSAGSAAAVAAGLCYGSVGSDTGGSIREPSGYAGIVGLKPTYGRVSTRGAIPLSWYLDHLGPMTRTVKDAALMLEAIAGYDPAEITSVDVPTGDFAGAIGSDTTSLRLGIPRAYFYEGLHPETEAALGEALAALKRITASQREIGPLAGDATYASLMDPYRTVLVAEAYAFHQEYVAKVPELYQPETLKRIRAGADIGTGVYISSRARLDLVRRNAAHWFDGIDALITPTSPVPPFSISELLGDLDTLRAKELQMLRNTRPFNALGLPTISVPCGFTKGGLPIGMQITGPPWGEATVLRLAHAYERETDWHKRRPPATL